MRFSRRCHVALVYRTVHGLFLEACRHSGLLEFYLSQFSGIEK